MTRLLRWLRRLFGLLPPARWEDGVIVRGAVYERLYAETVALVRANAPQAPITAPEFALTVRLYDRWPKGYEYNRGKILAPNVIPGDTGGTLCLSNGDRKDAKIITHEMKHAITGESGHPDWLFPNG